MSNNVKNSQLPMSLNDNFKIIRTNKYIGANLTKTDGVINSIRPTALEKKEPGGALKSLESLASITLELKKIKILNDTEITIILAIANKYKNGFDKKASSNTLFNRIKLFLNKHFFNNSIEKTLIKVDQAYTTVKENLFKESTDENAHIGEVSKTALGKSQSTDSSFEDSANNSPPIDLFTNNGSQQSSGEIFAEPDKNSSNERAVAEKRILALEETFKLITCKDCADMNLVDLNQVDFWLLELFTCIAISSTDGFKHRLTYIDHLSNESQISLLIAAKDLAKKISNINNKGGDDFLAIFTLLEEQFQKYHKNDSNFLANAPTNIAIDTAQEKQLEAILQQKISVIYRQVRKEANKQKLYQMAILTVYAAATFSAVHLAEKLLGKEILAIGAIIFAISIIYKRTLVVNNSH